MADILDDTDHGHPVAGDRIALEREALADGIIDVRPEALCEEVVDEGGPRPRGCPLVRPEEASPKELDSHRREVVGAGDSGQDHRVLLSRARLRPTFSLEEGAPVARE